MVNRIQHIPLFVLLILTFTTCNEQKKPVLVEKENYNKVVAYDFDGLGDMVVEDQLIITPINQRVLTASEIVMLDSIFLDSTNYGGDVANCFVPHFGVVYYKNDSIVEHIAVCLECNYLKSSIETPHSNSGFSGKGRVRINNLIKSLGFRYIEKKEDLIF